ncbi:amidase [Leptolyngbya boryana NIES-2135]|jgi:acetamidase/formamidase|uniref:Amidase n=1 Tax=Leptolyngbya boryana NIES-2135 TaxID=1973484 RepID=A0A1Z4JDA3_LEPBY|nr:MULTISPECIES: acetamidase/formamidase family protein [Leptolyngbya]BAY54774.1 amidase [Leptolyngbya boryana NIES-2135]MBD2365757.1 acetamidase/formamidase family protein [Leptolyngbya sp. FACHB-161]MBD2371937.1 acetamidase/formamidase family protein [Leptolyngbya sp. FACHB-238]MBD2396362.1 acetamidase/formamidase family protein [Leptolyngbya sp. FACHB-239]MBD2402884.1 acetamidase/formamidase family protein [Leptolyngbya sp. FACHB-402]
MPKRRDFLLGSAATATAVSMFPHVNAQSSKRPEINALQQGYVGQYQGGVYLLPANSETVQWGWFNNAEPPRARIKSGDTVVMETMMASLNQILPGSSIEAITKLRVDFPGRGPHSVTGPIFVEGAMPGDVLKIKINRIVPRSYGANWNLPGNLKLGQFPDKFTQAQVKHFYLDLGRGMTEFLPGIELPVRPFPGIIGVARAESGQYSTVPPGAYGGNLDCRELVQGTTIYLPVFVDGALLWSGDSHAAQGNGEINLTAIETAFSELNITVEVMKKMPLSFPRIETPTHWITMGYDRDLNKAIDKLEEETVKFVSEWKRLSSKEARQYMQDYGMCHVAEVVNQVKGTYCMLPKQPTPKVAPAAVKDTRDSYVTTATNADAMAAMNSSAMQMIERIAELKKLSLIDSYALASLAMDTRIGRLEPGARTIHNLLPRSLWVKKAKS